MRDERKRRCLYIFLNKSRSYKTWNDLNKSSNVIECLSTEIKNKSSKNFRSQATKRRYYFIAFECNANVFAIAILFFLSFSFSPPFLDGLGRAFLLMHRLSLSGTRVTSIKCVSLETPANV